ncbi:MAG TPA: hypothetical protein VNO26_17005 [Candidatus Limnocylindria bacterium]|nr:hypothetical protein [Candidatus Limnocylindria bacterium]
MRLRTIPVLLAAALTPVGAGAQPTPAPGYAIQSLPTPSVVAGGVVQRNGALLVGQGAFGPGLQSIVRLEAGRAVTIATGFGGLGGFDLAADGTLYVVDNCFAADFGCAEATTGDTVYAIPDALSRTTALDAADAELLPPGSIGFPFDVLSTPIGLLVSDAAGPGIGRVVRAETSGVTDVATGLDYAAGLAFEDPSLYVANLGGDFTGAVHEFVAGSPLGALVDGLAGAAGLALDGDGDLLLGAGNALLSVDAAGSATPLATGFGFAGDVAYDADREEALVLDFGASAVTVVCADDDGDGVCDATCDDGPLLEDARLSLKPGRNGGAGSLKLRAELRVDGGLTADPSEEGMRLQLLDADGVRVLDVLLPAERWRARKRGWRFRDRSGALMVTDVKVVRARGDDGLVRVAVRSRKRFAVGLAGLAFPLRAVVALDPLGECGASAFAGCETEARGAVVCE